MFEQLNLLEGLLIFGVTASGLGFVIVGVIHFGSDLDA